jgi:hypothetical protein
VANIVFIRRNVATTSTSRSVSIIALFLVIPAAAYYLFVGHKDRRPE